LTSLQSYIKDELNCLNFEVITNEEDYVVYKTDPDHKEMGQALKKAYTKQLKEKVGNLSREQVLEYLKNGTLMLEGVEIKAGWLKITKEFNDKYKADTKYGVDSNLENSVMLDMVKDDKLIMMGVSREIVNKV